ncbi:MAG: lipoprotein [Oscillospiraceae bacterium]|nr:lipoprotein [Oscillospiraceae bacterium]
MKKSLWAALFALLLTGCSIHYDESNISKLYDSERIIGSSRDAIEAKYGAFDREFIADDGSDLGAYYVNYDNRGLDPSYIHDTYFVEFENDVAVDAYFRETSIGG